MIIFATEQIEELWKVLTRFFKHSESGITVEKYLEICEQLGQEPTEEDMPVDWNDLPNSVQYAIHIYNKLGNRLQAEIGFIGKDYTNLPILLQLYDIDNIELTIDIINWLENRDIKTSSDQIKKMHEKMKKKPSLPKTGAKPSYRA